MATDFLNTKGRQVRDFNTPNPMPNPMATPVPGHMPGPGAVPKGEVLDAPTPTISNSAPIVNRARAPEGPKYKMRPMEGPVCTPGFTRVNPDCAAFSKEYTTSMSKLIYIGNTDMLLKYLYNEERRHRVTMPIKACGVDPIVFDNVNTLKKGVDVQDVGDAVDEESYFEIMIPEETESDQRHIYELIKVDGELYMSCMSECLDSEYLHKIIVDATTSMREEGNYIFRMVGLRRLAIEEGTTTDDQGNVMYKPGRLLETLRLNTFEMSALCSYMSAFQVDPTFEIIDGHECICFRMPDTQ